MPSLAESCIIPDWPAPARVRACVTTRAGGVSVGPFTSLNLGDHVGDDPQAVAENRRRLVAELGCRPAWLRQVHGTRVVEADPAQVAEADGCWTAAPGIACSSMTADCLPVLFCDRAGSRVAAAHAGWRGLAGGVLEATLEALALPAEQVLAWLGPAIGPQAFEVGPEVREAFLASHPEAAQAFVPSHNPGKFLADLYQLARIRLVARGITAVYGGGFCTFSDPRFFSYRRAARTGRFASLVWLQP
ncbi:peptidoglycan editing factor PgeF [Zestomonas thermotolerans]|uniref:peptidoglycan editing factor PgeF n=1 Tax=Zestomonas thermotolerans TaxID=157784 RepID=UPI000487D04B|nr:peptidoglycan editing factor PgeF [Pseudomonas thermotolerans]MBO2511793.1 peptidoglycan editing factor PgeF [Gammaproteobacteria bacterium]